MNVKVNPFNIAFGKEPMQLIERPVEFMEICDDFDNLNPESNAYVLTGVRGCGKTILLSSFRSYYRQRPGWIVVDLVPYKDMLELFAATLYQEGKFKKLFLKGDFSFSFQGLSFSISGDKPVTNVINMLSLMLEHAQKKNMRVLITIDEVSSSKEMKSFAHAFQLFLSKGYPVFLLMTGLAKNVFSLEAEKTLTFLLRAPKVRLSSLDKGRIAEIYRDSLGANEKQAIALAKFTKGYAYGFQLLGSLLFKSGKTQLDASVLREFDAIIRDRAYAMIYKELSERERQILLYASQEGQNDSATLMNLLDMKKGTLSTYKKRLADSGIIDPDARGKIKFTLPRFEEYLRYLATFEE